MSHSRANPKSSNVVAFDRLLKRLFNSIKKSNFNACVKGLEKIVYYISGSVYRNTLLSKHLVNQVYNALDQFIGLYPDKPQPYLLQAVFFARQHKVELALQAYNDIHHHFPWYKEAHYRHKLLVGKLKESMNDQGTTSLNISRKEKEIIDRAILKYIKNEQIFFGDIEFDLWKNGGQGGRSQFNLMLEKQSACYQPGAQSSLFKEKLQAAWVDRCSAAQGGSIRLLKSLIELVGFISLTSDDVLALFKAVAGFRAIYSDGMKANLLLAGLYEKLDFYNEACRIYQMLETNHPASAEAFVCHENLLRRQGEYSEADKVKQLQEISFNKNQALAENRNIQSLMLVEKLLAPVDSRFNPKQSVSSQENNHYNWQPEVPRYDQEDYARYQKIKEAFDRGAVKADDRLKKNSRPVNRASSQAGLLARFGHYDWQSKMPKEKVVSQWSQQRTPAPESHGKYIHPNGRPDAVRKRQAQAGYSSGFSYADVAKNKPQEKKKAFKKMGY